MSASRGAEPWLEARGTAGRRRGEGPQALWRALGESLAALREGAGCGAWKPGRGRGRAAAARGGGGAGVRRVPRGRVAGVRSAWCAFRPVGRETLWLAFAVPGSQCLFGSAKVTEGVTASGQPWLLTGNLPTAPLAPPVRQDRFSSGARSKSRSCRKKLLFRIVGKSLPGSGFSPFRMRGIEQATVTRGLAASYCEIASGLLGVPGLQP